MNIKELKVRVKRLREDCQEVIDIAEKYPPPYSTSYRDMIQRKHAYDTILTIMEE